MSTHNKYINRKKIVTRPRNRMVGENFKKATIATITIIIAAMIITSGAWLSNGHLAPSGGSPQVIATLVGNVSNPRPYYNTTNGYVSPNLWNLQNGNGNVTMQIYSNSSIFTKVYLSNLAQEVPVMAYSSIHFEYQIPMALSTVESDNFSSYVSFGIKYKSVGTFNDFGYDFFLGQGTNFQYEVMILLNITPHVLNITPHGFIAHYSVPIVIIPIIIDGRTVNVQWYAFPIVSSTPGVSGAIRFTPVHALNTSMTCLLSFAPFISYLESRNIISPSWSIVRIGIGSEYGTQSSNFISYSFWMYSYFILNGTKYQVVQPSGGS